MGVLRWAEAHIKIARMTLTIKLDGNWSSFQLANSAPPLSVTDSAIAPSARMLSSSDQAAELMGSCTPKPFQFAPHADACCGHVAAIVPRTGSEAT